MHGFASYPLPVLALSAGFAAYLGRFGRTLLLHETGQDYCRAARARGLSESATLVKHALPNAAIPLLTAVTLQVAALLGGAILTEVIFRWPGIGELTVNAVQRHDLDLVAGIVMWGVLVYTLMVGLADFLILAIDPVSREG
jgi:peptide/nickel transport system permease protein